MFVATLNLWPTFIIPQLSDYLQLNVFTVKLHKK